jgi:Ni,Fe-hydrogenase III large subunit
MVLLAENARIPIDNPATHLELTMIHAIIGNIVPDFPLINKSFNLSYRGHDL